MSYFETITDASAFKAKRPTIDIDDLNKIVKRQLGAGSKWSKNQLFAARLVIRTIRWVSGREHLLPSLQKYFDESVTARTHPPIRELLQDPGQVNDLTETELVHRYGAHLGPFWAALATFGDVVAAEEDGGDVEDVGESSAQKRPHSSRSEDSISSSPPLGDAAKRVRTQVVWENFTSSANIRAGSSSPTTASELPSQGSSAGFVGDTHKSDDVPEQATVEICSLFLRHVLQNCPPQHDTRQQRPECLVEFSRTSRQLSGMTATGAEVRATADGEMVLYRLVNGKYVPTGHLPALLEAKKRFAVIDDGVPVMTDAVLGQTTCEAIALRLQSKQQNTAGGDDKVFVIVAVRRYLRLLEFSISDSYIASLTNGQDLVDYVELWATPWFDLRSPGGRCNVVDNIVALVRRQSA